MIKWLKIGANIMEINRLLKLTGLGAIIVILVIFGVMGFVMYDFMSYTAADSQNLSPTESEVGKALVVYDPGLSGQPKDAAEAIAKDLQEKGYFVTLTGISSEEAKNTSGYNIIVVGGPIYAANASKSVQSYLSALKPDNDAKIAVFAVGEDADILNNPEMLKKEVAPLPEGISLQIKALTKFIQNEDFNKKSEGFVNSILN